MKKKYSKPDLEKIYFLNIRAEKSISENFILLWMHLIIFLNKKVK